MLKIIGRVAMLCTVLALTASCADDTKFLFGLRGKWQLESRKLPDGKVLAPPVVSGMYEWYPMSKTKAHVTASVSRGEDEIQLATYTYEIVQSGFTRIEHTRVGGGYTPAPQPTFETPGEATQGTIQVQGNAWTLTQADGTLQTYPDITTEGVEDATFTVTFTDGTVDSWRRTADQLGVLPK
jgi:hypothetical protein